MSQIKNNFLILIALHVLLQTAGAADKNTDRKKGLDAQQVQQIQAIGQAVLTAKKNTPADPDMEILRQRVKELHQAITELDSPALSLGNVSTFSLKPDGAATSDIAPDKEEKKERVKREERENKVRSVLNEVRKQRAFVQVASHKDTGEHASMKRNAASKVEELENAGEDVLNSRLDERAEKLTALKERLTVKHRSQVTAPDTGKKTPTISTIVHHREQ